jgi:hypothetical protein
MRRRLGFRLLRRRLTISAPRMAIRSALPWPMRWAGAAVVLGFCAAIALWAFELGKDLAGVEHVGAEEVRRLQIEVEELRQQRDQGQSMVNTAASRLTAEMAVQEQMAARIRVLEAENRSLRDDLGFFENLIPASGSGGLAIRALQAEVLDGAKLKWQVLVIQPARSPREFRGRLEMSVSGSLEGKPWAMEINGGSQPLQFRQYRRAEGLVDLPPLAVVKNVSAKVVEGTATRAVQSIKL